MAAALSAPHVVVTGGSGYIGSHTCVKLLEAGYRVTVLDNLVNSKVESLRRVGELTGKSDLLDFHEVDLCDYEKLDSILAKIAPCQACIHFAGLKAVGESTQKPLEYYENNVGGTLALLGVKERVARALECRLGLRHRCLPVAHRLRLLLQSLLSPF